MKSTKKSTFEQRFVGFVDILGFRSLVKQMDDDPTLFRTVRDTLKTLEQHAEECRAYRRSALRRRRAIIKQGSVPLLPASLLSSLQMTAFSDCYVISETTPAWHVLATVQALGARLLRSGVFCRGAVVHGRAYHRGPVTFGPAVIEAYELESQVTWLRQHVERDGIAPRERGGRRAPSSAEKRPSRPRSVPAISRSQTLCKPQGSWFTKYSTMRLFVNLKGGHT